MADFHSVFKPGTLQTDSHQITVVVDDGGKLLLNLDRMEANHRLTPNISLVVKVFS